MSAPTDYFDSESLREDLKGKTVRGGAITATAQGVAIAVGFVSIPILTRLLDPADFGLVAMVAVFSGFGAMFVDSGLSMATVQRQDIRHQQVSNLFWITTLLGAGLTLLFMASAPLISWFYDEPKVYAITIALACQFLLNGLALQHQALMRRAMQFNGLAVIRITSQIVGVIVAILWAWRHYGLANDYWALVLLPIMIAATRLAMIWGFCPWRPGLPRRGAGTRSMVEFGANLTGFTFLNYFVRNTDNLLIGWWWGADLLGGYERAYKLFLAPMRSINGPLGGVMVPALSRLTAEPDRYRRYYLQVVGKLTLVTIPLACFMFSSAEIIVVAFLGPGWEQVAPILRVLAVVGVVQAIGNTFGWLYASQGRGADMLKWAAMAGPVLVVSFFAGIAWGPLGVAIAYSATGLFVVFPCNVLYTTRVGPVRPGDILYLFPVPLTVGLAAGAGGAAAWFAPEGCPPFVRLSLATSLAFLAAFGAAWSLPSSRSALVALIAAARNRFPNSSYRPGTANAPGVGSVIDEASSDTHPNS